MYIARNESYCQEDSMRGGCLVHGKDKMGVWGALVAGVAIVFNGVGVRKYVGIVVLV